MEQYKVYKQGNYLTIEHNGEFFNGLIKEVFVDKNNKGRSEYKFFNVKDWNSNKAINISEILKQDGSVYTEQEFSEFYTTNTGNFNGGGTSPTFSVTGDSVDNTDPLNPTINAIPLSGTTFGNPVSGDIIIGDGVNIKYTLDSTDSFFIGDITKGAINIADSDTIPISIIGGVNSRGIAGNTNFTANITNLDYTQKIYVDAPSTSTQTQRSTSTSGTDNVSNLGRNVVYIHETSPITDLTINLPANPVNNQMVTIVSVEGIINLILTALVGTIVGTVSTLSALGNVKFIWLSSQNKWYKIN